MKTKIIQYLIYGFIIFLLHSPVSATTYHNSFNSSETFYLPVKFEVNYSKEVPPGDIQTINISIQNDSGGYIQISGYKLYLDDIGVKSPMLGSQEVPIGLKLAGDIYSVLKINFVKDTTIIFTSKVDCGVSANGPGSISTNHIVFNDHGLSKSVVLTVNSSSKDNDTINLEIVPNYDVTAVLKAKVIIVGEQEIWRMNLTQTQGSPMIVPIKVSEPPPPIPLTRNLTHLILLIIGTLLIVLSIYIYWKWRHTRNRINSFIESNSSICSGEIRCPIDNGTIYLGERAFRCPTCGVLYHIGCVRNYLRTSNTCIICGRSLI